MNCEAVRDFDVVLLGAGLAGLTLARHLLLETDLRILLVEKRNSVPPLRQKVGESSVQLAGYYFSRVLDLEEYLVREHCMKYNLRFYWKSGARENTRFEDYSHSYIRQFSNIASYQIDRNTFEKELLDRNLGFSRFTYQSKAKDLEVNLAEDPEQRHRVSFRVGDEAWDVRSAWVVDTTGRRRLLAGKRSLKRTNSIDHGSFFWWVEGLVDIDKLTDASLKQIRLKRDRQKIGHLPFWQATNHFCDEGLWFWVIPLQGKTSLGLVYDREVVPNSDVFSVEKATRWVCERFPLFARDLPNRKVLDFGGYKSFSHDCVQTISPSRWAIAGEAGRFSDPLYSPGSDLIAIYNTLIVDAIQTDNPQDLSSKCSLYEQLMRAVYQAYIPTYDTSYNALGDQETFSLKYTWELTVYFAGYVFPFVNDFFTDRRFLIAFLRMFSSLGPVNRSIQRLLSQYYQWKKEHRCPPAEPIFFELTALAPLARAAETFYSIGVTVDEAKKVLGEQVAGLDELARFIISHIAAVVLDEPAILTHRSFIESLRPSEVDLESLRELWQRQVPEAGSHNWSFDPVLMDVFRTPARSEDSSLGNPASEDGGAA